MSDNKPLFTNASDLLDSLRFVIPCNGMLYIGAGDGRAVIEQFQDWDLQSMLLVEANPDYQDQLQNNTSKISNWRCATGLLGNSESEQAYYLTSNPAENGVLDPEQLKTIWPNLKENSHITLQQSTVDSLLHSAKYSSLSSSINWVIIDCLPALPILEGAFQAIKNWEVIRVRVIFDGEMDGVNSSQFAKIENFMTGQSFRCCSVLESYHPAIGTAIFVKDWKYSLNKNIEKMEKEKGYFQTTIDELNRQASERQTQLEQQLSELKSQLETARDKISQLQQAVSDQDEQAQRASEREEQLEAQLSELTKERKIEIDRLTETNEKLKAQTDERQAQINQLTSILDEQAKMAKQYMAMLTEKENQLTNAERMCAKQKQQQQLIDQEILKAEAQIDLIKDVLLREIG